MRIKIPSVFIFLFFSCLLVAQDKQSDYRSDIQAMDDIFLADNLHMNTKGYAIWQKAIRPYLLK